MRQLSNLQVNEHITFQQTVIENQIDEEVLFVEGKALLACLKQKALPKFQQEMLYILNDRGFEIRFGVGCLVLESKELENVRLLQNVLWS